MTVTSGYRCPTHDRAVITDFQKANGLGEGYLGGEDWYYFIK